MLDFCFWTPNWDLCVHKLFSSCFVSLFHRYLPWVTFSYAFTNLASLRRMIQCGLWRNSQSSRGKCKTVAGALSTLWKDKEKTWDKGWNLVILSVIPVALLLTQNLALLLGHFRTKWCCYFPWNNYLLLQALIHQTSETIYMPKGTPTSSSQVYLLPMEESEWALLWIYRLEKS